LGQGGMSRDLLGLTQDMLSHGPYPTTSARQDADVILSGRYGALRSVQVMVWTRRRPGHTAGALVQE
jgi:hypothetical protein